MCITMKRFAHLVCFSALLLLLSGFFWSDPSWEQVNATIDRQYPSVKNIDIDSLRALLAEGNKSNKGNKGKNFILLDVRDADEFAVSHLPNAVNIHETSKVNYPKDTPIVVYCSVGLRSADFAEKLGDLGFTEIMNLRGSIFAWGNKGYPLMRGSTTVHVVHPYNKRWGKLLKPELHSYRVN